MTSFHMIAGSMLGLAGTDASRLPLPDFERVLVVHYLCGRLHAVPLSPGLSAKG